MGKNKKTRSGNVCAVEHSGDHIVDVLRHALTSQMDDHADAIRADLSRMSFGYVQDMDSSTAKMIVEMVTEDMIFDLDFKTLVKIATALSAYDKTHWSFAMFQDIWKVNIKIELPYKEACKDEEIRRWLFESESKYRYRAHEHGLCGGYKNVIYPKTFSGGTSIYDDRKTLKEAISLYYTTYKEKIYEPRS